MDFLTILSYGIDIVIGEKAMLKLSKNGIGLLTAQYRSVLRKCAVLNMFAAGMMLFVGTANATTLTENDNFVRVYKTVPAGATNALEGPLFVPSGVGHLATEVFNGQPPYSVVGAWIQNYDETYIGYSSSTTPSSGAVISNKHNLTASDDTATFGGVLSNENRDTNETSKIVLRIANTNFSNNSATAFRSVDSDTSISAGGVIANVVDDANGSSAIIADSKFNNNYVMGKGSSLGGALYNGSVLVVGPDGFAVGYASGIINTNNNTYTANTAGNFQLASSSSGVRENIMQPWIDAGRKASEVARGGAVYNNGVLNSNGDNFYNNYVIGTTAEGGAIYNTQAQTGDFISKGELTISGEEVFDRNYAGTSTENGIAYGGAIYNNSKISMNGSGKLNFRNNYTIVYSVTAGESMGGAIYNDTKGVFDSIISATFIGNYAKAEIAEGQAFGGAVANKGKMTVLYSQFGAENQKGNTVSAKSAGGGAIYNDGTADQKATISFGGVDQVILFNGNEAQAKIDNATDNFAYGGAIYNGENGEINSLRYAMFSNNTAKAAMSNEQQAYGGAVFNKGTIISNNSGYIFNNNQANGGQAYGGAIYNEGDWSFANTGELTFTDNKANGEAQAGGGAFFNTQDSTVATISNATFRGNNALSNAAESEVFGGAIANKGTVTIADAKFYGNTADAASSNVHGGGIYNDGILNITGSGEVLFDDNTTTTSFADRDFNDPDIDNGVFATGGAIYNGANGTINTITKTTFNHNNSLATFDVALGGAIGNEGVVNVKDAQFTDNQAVGVVANGGAVYNNNTLNVQENADVVMLGNKAEGQNGATGGAIYNSGTIATINNTTFTSNTATAKGDEGEAYGGAIANDGIINIASATFNNNSTSGEVASLGGAVYNDNTINIDAKGSDSIAFNNNSAEKGGAVYNEYDADATTGSISGTLAGNATMTFNGNKAVDLELNYINEKSIDKDERNRAKVVSRTKNYTNGAGGAIYNDKDATIDLNLQDAAKLLLNTTSDVAYSEGTFKVTGSNAAPSENVEAKGVDNSKTQFVVNSTLLGTGYDISNTQLNFGNTGFLDEDSATVKLSNNEINLAKNTYVKLSSNDELDNNDFYVDKDSLVQYEEFKIQMPSFSGGFDMANNITNYGTVRYIAYNNNTPIVDNKPDGRTVLNNQENSIANGLVVNRGTIDASYDRVLTNVHIDTLKSENGNQFTINLDNEKLKADIIRIDEAIYGTTNVVFRDMEDNQLAQVNLELLESQAEEVNGKTVIPSERIYFAQVVDSVNPYLVGGKGDYTFTVNANNPEYEILVGYEEATSAGDGGKVYDWFLYRGDEREFGLVNLPRAAIEQTRNIRLHTGRAERGQCSCYTDNCNNSFCQYEESDDTKVTVWATPVYTKGSFDAPMETDFTVKGVDFGLDFQPNYDDLFGIFGSYRDGKYETDGKSKLFKTKKKSELEMTSLVGGLYYRRYIGDFYMLGAIYGGKIDVDMKGDSTASVDGFTAGAQGELGYDIHTSERTTLTPSLRATYDYFNFDETTDSKGRKASFDDTHNVELEAGLKLQYQFNDESQLPTTAYVKPSIIQTIASGGDATIGGKKFNKLVESETYGRIEVGTDAEIIQNLSLGVFGNYTFGSEYQAWGVGGNVRYTW